MARSRKPKSPDLAVAGSIVAPPPEQGQAVVAGPIGVQYAQRFPPEAVVYAQYAASDYAYSVSRPAASVPS